MAATWYAGATRKPIAGVTGGGSMVGGPARAIHHTTEGSTIAGAEATYAKTKNAPHFTIDYAHDVIHQHLPVNVAATALKNPAGGVQTNRQGDYNVQIEWVGFAKNPFTTHDGKLVNAGPKVRAFFDWLRKLRIPDTWPMGAPKPYPSSYGLGNGDRNAKTWTSKGGHYGHSQVPENEHGDPGAIDPAFVKQGSVPAWYTGDRRYYNGPDLDVVRGKLGLPLHAGFDHDLAVAVLKKRDEWGMSHEAVIDKAFAVRLGA